jgi:alkanesulfonate monooxygenase SsuD/methylene tetrahydromethanopterin reductase-like flavin-dependent oxidoreductase (luciferase family)/hemerythrin-like domain-containing protein
MSDYGHELEFGIFVTPTSQEPDDVVDLAVLAEGSGLDLVTFQDHPYQPAFLDSWTLISYVAARTERVRLAGNVLNLPLRHPAVLARSLASLDLLSDGRVELGIGAGGFRDAIAAMGGPKRLPGESVDALAEGIEVIRQIWDTGTRGGVRFDGRYYKLSGAKRGPAPAHPIGIWVGAYKPRMLRLTGRLADGWLPSLGYLQPGQLGEFNAIIDAAAEQSSREPAAVRRLLNVSGRFAPTASGLLDGPPEHWADQLAELALTEGISTFILATDDPVAIGTYAAEVAPAVRQLVAAARSGPAQANQQPQANLQSQADPQPRADPQPQASPQPRANREAATPGLDVTPTEDDGTRLSTTRLWDEAARPSRPVSPPPAGGYSRAGRQASADLVRVHDMLRQELTTIRDLIVEVQKGAIDAGRARSELNQMTMRQNNWTMGTYCESYCRVVTAHHGLEDAAVFPHLRARDSELGPVLDRLQAEHRVIHGVLDSVDRALVRFIERPDDFTDLQEAVDVLTDTLLSHLAYEERQLIEPLARHGYY